MRSCSAYPVGPTRVLGGANLVSCGSPGFAVPWGGSWQQGAMLVLQLDPHLTTDKMNQYLLTGDLAGQVKVQNIQVDCKKSVNSFFLFSNLIGKVNSNLFFFLWFYLFFFFNASSCRSKPLRKVCRSPLLTLLSSSRQLKKNYFPLPAHHKKGLAEGDFSLSILQGQDYKQ